MMLLLNVVISIAKHMKNHVSITRVQNLCKVVYNQHQTGMFTLNMLVIYTQLST